MAAENLASQQLEERVIVGMFQRGLLGFPEEPIRLKSGRLSPYYYNDRPSLSFNRRLQDSRQMTIAEQRAFRTDLATAFAERFSSLDNKIDHVFGKAQAATAPAAVGAYVAGLSYLWERVDEPGKASYGAHKKIEGDYVTGELVGLGDDVVTDGASKVAGAQVLRDVGLIPVSVTIKFDRQEGGMEVLAEHGFEANAVTSLSRAIPVLYERALITDREVASVNEYHQQLLQDGLTSTYEMFHP